MKKKYREGIVTFESLLQLPTFKSRLPQLKSRQQRERHRFIKPLVHLYKGYG